MGRGSRIISMLFGLAVVGILVVEITRPKPLNWRPDFTRHGKSPFGCYVLYNELAGLFPDAAVATISESTFEWLQQRDTNLHSSLFIVNDQTPFDAATAQGLLQYVASGNTVLISSHSLGYSLADSLNLSLETHYDMLEEPVELSLEYPGFERQAEQFDKGYLKTYFSDLDRSRVTVLGRVRFREEGTSEGDPLREEINFIRLSYGSGTFFIHTTPYAFGNYYVLGGKEAYVSSILSYLNDQPLYWDNYEKSGRVVVDSPMRFVLSQASLRWAYYLGITGLLLLVLIRSRRMQRVIPIMAPLKNSSVAFAQTVGDLYFENRDYTDLIRKRIGFLKESLSSKYLLRWAREDGDLARKISLKTGVEPETCEALVSLVRTLETTNKHSEQDLMQLHRLLSPFKQ